MTGQPVAVAFLLVDMLEAKVHGLKELDAALTELGKRTSVTVVKAALKKAAQPVVDEARALVPKRTGRLAESIVVSERLSKRQKRNQRHKMPGSASVFVGGAWPKGAHAHLVEFGTRGHLISRRAKQVLSDLVEAFGTFAWIPPMPARPFLRPAWDSKRQEVLRSLGAEIWKSITKAKARMAARN